MTVHRGTPLSLASALLLAACDHAPPPNVVRPVVVVHPQPADAAFSALAGDVHARLEPELAFRIPGKLVKRNVDVGVRVHRGDVLAELDPQDVRLQVAAARAQVASADADLVLAKNERDRYVAMGARKLVSQTQVETAENTYRAAEARVKQMRAQASVAGNQADYATLQAPADGMIAQRSAEAGQVVTAGQAVFVLAVDGEREVAVGVPERDVATMKLGDPALIELWAAPGKRYAGHVRELARAADAVSRTFSARVAFDDPAANAIEPGQSARVYFAQAEAATTRIPLSALSAENGKPFVWVVDPATSRLRRTPVEVGPYAEDSVPVRSGLDASAWVVAAGVHVLREGQDVVAVDRENRPVVLAGAH
jgi:multidrug efflux system membrane fusion protein